MTKRWTIQIKFRDGETVTFETEEDKFGFANKSGRWFSVGAPDGKVFIYPSDTIKEVIHIPRETESEAQS